MEKDNLFMYTIKPSALYKKRLFLTSPSTQLSA